MNPSLVLALSLLFAGAAPAAHAPSQPSQTGRIVVSPNQRFLQYENGVPFFWLGDTGWLMLQRLDRDETERYLENRRRKGYTVIQAMVMHSGADRNAYGASALVERDPARPAVTPGHSLTAAGEYDYWDHVDWALDRAASKGLYVAMVPAWGSLVKRGQVNETNVAAYARVLAARFRNRPNVFWMNGGDLQGDIKPEVWQTLGRTLKAADPDHLVTFHPFGRTQSSTWFHAEPWLDFNMFQSGHKRYDQDAESPGAKGEDNWRYVFEDFAKQPPKPTLDAEPSYEGIPQGLHDPKEPRWKDGDARRYAYWSVFAGAFGHTYGADGVMQMRKPVGGNSPSGGAISWYDAIDHPGAGQMQHLKNLMLSRPFFERVSDDGIVVAGSGPRYERVTATRGQSYAFVYSFLGRPFQVRLGAISGKQMQAWWYNPRDGTAASLGVLPNQGAKEFSPPGAPAPGNDWVLVLDDAAQRYPAPGAEPFRER
jgi:hypothetical protein